MCSDNLPPEFMLKNAPGPSPWRLVYKGVEVGRYLYKQQAMLAAFEIVTEEEAKQKANEPPRPDEDGEDDAVAPRGP